MDIIREVYVHVLVRSKSLLNCFTTIFPFTWRMHFLPAASAALTGQLSLLSTPSGNDLCPVLHAACDMTVKAPNLTEVCNKAKTNPWSGLNNAAEAAGKLYFGTATDSYAFGRKKYMQNLNNTKDFGQVTPGNAMKVNNPLARFQICWIRLTTRDA
jgi:hypothetical protein